MKNESTSTRCKIVLQCTNCNDEKVYIHSYIEKNKKLFIEMDKDNLIELRNPSFIKRMYEVFHNCKSPFDEFESHVGSQLGIYRFVRLEVFSVSK